MTGIPRRLIFIQDDVPVLIQSSSSVDPHVMLIAVCAVFLCDTYRRLICLQHMVIIKLFMQIIIKNGQIPFRTEDGPVGHFTTSNRNTISFEFLLLTIKRNGIYILCIYNSSFQRCRYQAVS